MTIKDDWSDNVEDMDSEAAYSRGFYRALENTVIALEQLLEIDN